MKADLSQHELEELRHRGETLEDSNKYEIANALQEAYKKGKIDGLESAFEKLEIDIDLNND